MDDDGNPKHNSSGDAILLFPSKTPEKLRGITFKHRLEDGTVRSATVLELVIETNLENEKGRQLLDNFKIRYDSDQV